jgi:GNAT superfamily N-acetyltransferase
LTPSWSIRPAGIDDIEATFDVRGATRQAAVPRERLARLGITPASVAEAMRGDTYRSWVGVADGGIVGFCNADAATGEVIVLAVKAGCEGTGLGRALLAAAVGYLHARGCPRIWLMAGADPALRAHRFYRAHGWEPTGRTDGHGDEELELRGVVRSGRFQSV